jgi:guanidinopropionase
VGADIVEVAPPFDVGGITALAGATVMFEVMCVMAKHIAGKRSRSDHAEVRHLTPLTLE